MSDKNKPTSKNKKPVSQKRVAVVLASLVATLTVSSGLLLLMENGPLGASPPPAFSVSRSEFKQLITPEVPLQTASWRFIIVYESGDLEAGAASLAEGRDKGVGPQPGNAVRSPANFHFVVDGANSKRGALDGELEVGSAWLNQRVGTPYAGWPDTRYYHTNHPWNNAIGVCISGDLSQRPYSDAQCRSLTQLVRELQQQCQIRKESVKFQWELGPSDIHATPAQIAFAEEFRAALD